jgi:hypothetical protein
LAACGGGSKTDSADAGASQQNAKKGGQSAHLLL